MNFSIGNLKLKLDVTVHALERIKARYITVEEITDTLTKGKVVSVEKDNTVKLCHKTENNEHFIVLGIDAATMEAAIITTYHRGKKDNKVK